MNSYSKSMQKNIRVWKRKKNRLLTESLMGLMIKKIRGKTFVIEIYFDKKSKDTFQGKLLKVVQTDERFESK